MPHKRKSPRTRTKKAKLLASLRLLRDKRMKQYQDDVHAGKYYRTGSQRRLDKAIVKVENLLDKNKVPFAEWPV
jgi:hypothetical protein